MRRLIIVLGFAAILLGVVLYRGYVNTFDIQITRTEIELVELPWEFDGYRIALISCLHSGRFAVREKLLRKKLERLDADLLVIAGDLGRRRVPSRETIVACRRVFTELDFPDGMIATKGNHDRRELFAPLRKMGIHVLFNECYTVYRRRSRSVESSDATDRAAETTEKGAGSAASLTFVGVGTARRRDPDWIAALRQAEADGLRIGICHSPDGVVSASRHGIPLVLCGHTHGGQIRIPGVGPLITETRLVGREYASGFGRFGDTLLYVNRGIGWTGLPLRFRCPPEISMLTLRRAR